MKRIAKSAVLATTHGADGFRSLLGYLCGERLDLDDPWVFGVYEIGPSSIKFISTVGNAYNYDTLAGELEAQSAQWEAAAAELETARRE